MGTLKAPNVLVLGTVLSQGKGGVWRHNKELLPRVARLLAAAGGSLSILEGREACAFDLPPEVMRIPSKVPFRPAMRRAMAEGHALRELLAERTAEGHPFDLVHTAHQPVPRGFDTPISLLIHDLRSLDLKHTPFSRRLFAREIIGHSAKRAALLMTVTEAMADNIAYNLEVERSKIQVINNAGDHFLPIERQAIPDAPLLCIGHLEPRKNQRLLIETLASDTSLPDVNFLGSAKGNAQEELMALASSLGVAERIHFLGATSDEELCEQLSKTSCVVLPSLLEGFGISVLEAQRAAAPLAISAIPAHKEVAPEAATFINEAADCARAIHVALGASQQKLDDQKRLANQRYSWDRSAEQLFRAWSS